MFFKRLKHNYNKWAIKHELVEIAITILWMTIVAVAAVTLWIGA